MLDITEVKNLDEAMDKFVKAETLTGNMSVLYSRCSFRSIVGDNKYLCIKCGMKQDAEKGLKFATLPKILTISLKVGLQPSSTVLSVCWLARCAAVRVRLQPDAAQQDPRDAGVRRNGGHGALRGQAVGLERGACCGRCRCCVHDYQRRCSCDGSLRVNSVDA